MSTTRNKALVRRFYDDVINRRRFDQLDELAAPSFVDHNPEPGQAPGIDGVKRSFGEFLTAFPDLRIEVQFMLAEGDTVGSWVRMTGTHHGKFAHVEATGRELSVTGFDWLRIENGKVVERWGVFDNATMLGQLGVVPGPTASDLKALSKRYYVLLDAGRGDLAKIKSELVHPNHVTHFAGQLPVSADGLQQLASGFWAAFPDLEHVIVSQIAEGDRVMNRLRAKATHKGDFAGVPPTGKRVEVDVIATHRWSGGKLTEQWVELDMVGLLQQLGAIPTP